MLPFPYVHSCWFSTDFLLLFLVLLIIEAILVGALIPPSPDSFHRGCLVFIIIACGCSIMMFNVFLSVLSSSSVIWFPCLCLVSCYISFLDISKTHSATKINAIGESLSWLLWLSGIIVAHIALANHDCTLSPTASQSTCILYCKPLKPILAIAWIEWWVLDIIFAPFWLVGDIIHNWYAGQDAHNDHFSQSRPFFIDQTVSEMPV